MMLFTLCLLLVLFNTQCAAAAELLPPVVTGSPAQLMPEAESFGEGLWMILQDILPLLRPDIAEGARVCAAILAAAILVSILQTSDGTPKTTAVFVGTAAVSISMLRSVNSMIRLASDTVQEMTEYGKLLLPVMTTAMAAQGSPGTSAALNGGTTVFSLVLTSLISKVLIPGVYLFLGISIAAGSTGEEMLKGFRDIFKSSAGWCLKTLLSLFCGYMGITGVISGTTDALAVKTAKAALSTVVPVVGSILSDASESLLLSVAAAKNAAGLYGVFAVLVIFLDPFLKIGCQYFLLKITAAICGVFGCKRITDLVNDFACALGLLLGMTASVCLLLLISTVCFMKGVS